MKKFSAFVRSVGHHIYLKARKYGRNFLALIKRIRLAWRHHDEDEVLNAILTLMEEGIRSILILGFYCCLVAGFFKPHCWAMAILYVIVIAIWNSNIADRREQEGRRA